MRILFIGAVEFSEFCLLQILKCGGNVIGVITQDRPWINEDYVDLCKTAAENKIPCYKLRYISDPDAMTLIRQLKPDIIFVLGFSQIIPKEILEIPPQGVIGCHSTLLPKGRGRHPLIWAMVKGLEESGTTFLYLDEGVDSGDILMQKPFQITLEDDARTIYEKDKACAAEIIREILPRLEDGSAPRIPQDHSQASYRPKRTHKDGIIDWSCSAMDIYNLIRALTKPYPGASAYIELREIKIWKAAPPTWDIKHVESTQELPTPGTVLSASARELVVAAKDLPLTILEWECLDKELPIPIKPGSVLTNVGDML